ncbi:MAG: MBL fold metallo-hydrolase [Acidobacteria bacterium]|nr:MBL fold metallo-hydrolase [Acidobacteriota bacterium]
MMKRKTFAVALWVLVLIVGLDSGCAQQPTRSITNITGDVYRAQNNTHFTVFLVTPEGIILGDPINTEFATWLKEELARRFDVPVRYVLYSHHHYDHVSGGEVFADTATFVGHQNMTERLALLPSNTPLPSNAQEMDRNGNGRIEQSEASGNLETNFAYFDENSDGALSGAEIVRGPLADVYPPNETYADRKTISLGGKTVEMIYTGIITHTDDMSVMYFPEERVVFVVDFITIKRLPFQTLGNGRLDAWLNAIRGVENIDFDYVVPGHGEVGNKADLAEHRGYLEELRDAVADGIAAGKTLEQLQASILLEDYKDWQSFDAWRPMNIEGMYNMLNN